jgi:hypothetical protein
MGALGYAMLRKYGLTLIGIVLLVVTLFLPHGSTRTWLTVLAFLLVVAQTVLNAVGARRGRTTPDG